MISFVVKMCATQLFSHNQISAVLIVQLKIKFGLFCLTVLNQGNCILRQLFQYLLSTIWLTNDLCYFKQGYLKEIALIMARVQ